MAKIKKLLTPLGRASFPSIWEKDSFGDGEPNYNITLLFPPGTDLSEMENEIAKVVKDKWPKGRPKNMKHWPPIKECDEEYAGYDKGWHHVKFKTSLHKPEVVGPNKEEVLRETPPNAPEAAFFPGCWCRVSYSVMAIDNQFGKFIRLNLGNIQVSNRPAEPLSGVGSTADEDFDSFEDIDDAALLGEMD